MRKEEIKLLNQPYNSEKDGIDRRFNSTIGANVPSATQLVKEIFSDIDINTFGIRWWTSLPTEERILISDYLYQCATGIEENLIEAKLHYFELLEVNEKINDRIANIVSRDSSGRLIHKMPKSNAPIDDLPYKLEKMHLCGFFRAIGSSLDCLGAVIIGILALPVNLRKSDINKAEKALQRIPTSANQGSLLQTSFRDFFENVKIMSGPKDWLEWADQYRNMYVHRGRRILFTQTIAKKNLIYDSNGLPIPRSESITHLAKFPDRSDVEAFIKSKEIFLNEPSEITLSCIFKSCREMNENICEKLLSIWRERRENPSILEQPLNQWDDKIRLCSFDGYDISSQPIDADLISSHPNIRKRMQSASVTDSKRKFWDNSKWK